MQLEDAKAKIVWDIFAELSRVPRPSKHEDKILDWAKSFADKHGFEYKCDEVGNLLIIIPASKGYEAAESICIQAHVDMVCEKAPDNPHDFMNDPLTLRELCGWVMATDTTLGADNGVGVAMALAAATDDTCQHPKLELLLTVDEETGLTGAYGLQPDFFSSSKLINTDSEDESFIMGCAGGQECELYLPIQYSESEVQSQKYDLIVSGLSGGHSGVNINADRANAIKILASALRNLRDVVGIELFAVEGGSARNAIPRDAKAIIGIDPSQLSKAEQVVSDLLQECREDFGDTDPDVYIKITPSSFDNDSHFSAATINRLIEVLLSVPHGPIRYCEDFEGIVETSNNLAKVGLAEHGDSIQVLTLQRSCVMERLDEITDIVASVGEVNGCEVEVLGRYPGWQPNLGSALLAVAKKAFEKVYGKEAEVEIIHAGLECGLIGDKYPGIDMISMGPIIENAHSPQEKVQIESVDKSYELLKEILASSK